MQIVASGDETEDLIPGQTKYVNIKPTDNTVKYDFLIDNRQYNNLDAFLRIHVQSNSNGVLQYAITTHAFEGAANMCPLDAVVVCNQEIVTYDSDLLIDFHVNHHSYMYLTITFVSADSTST